MNHGHPAVAAVASVSKTRRLVRSRYEEVGDRTAQEARSYPIVSAGKLAALNELPWSLRNLHLPRLIRPLNFAMILRKKSQGAVLKLFMN
jgi:hypothetical protein